VCKPWRVYRDVRLTKYQSRRVHPRLRTRSSGGRTWWAHFEFTRINIAPIIFCKKIEELREPGASAYGPRRASCDAEAVCGSRLDAVRLIAPSRRERPIVRAAPRRRA